VDIGESITQKTMNNTILAASYARACYGGGPDRLQRNVYPAQSLPYIVGQNATCSFKDGTCVYGNTAAFRMDTRLINSHFDLDINASSHERAQTRMVTTCAPLHVRNFTYYMSGNERKEVLPQDCLWELQYGNVSTDTAAVSTNYTFSYNPHAAMDSFGYSINGGRGSLAQLQRGVVEYATGRTSIIPGLSIYLSNHAVSKAMCYSQKITDPQVAISFSVLGVVIILIVGGFIIFTSP
jgi:hypothetical protein